MNEQLQIQVAQLRSSNGLGREGLLTRLFDFLLERSLAGAAPKEIEIAIEVFGKGPDFLETPDSTVRVYVHKLRRKLDEYYAGIGRKEPVRLAIPKGEYRITLEEVGASVPTTESEAVSVPVPEESELQQDSTPAWRLSNSRPLWIAVILVASLLVNLMLIARQHTAAANNNTDKYAAIRANPFWSKLFVDDAPINVVIGDYYIFGELSPDGTVRRLIRDFDINSSNELYERMQSHHELSEQYENLDLRYLPVASATVLAQVMPLLASSGKRIQVSLASNIDGQTLKSGHIVYIGFLSGMGMLRDLAFQNSRFYVGASFDEIVDGVEHRTYTSEAGEPALGSRPYRDYGYLSSFIAPSGKQIVVIAGTRDVALMHMAEVMASSSQLDTLTSAASGPTFEALYEVTGIDSTDVHGRLLATAPVDVRKPRSAQEKQ